MIISKLYEEIKKNWGKLSEKLLNQLIKIIRIKIMFSVYIKGKLTVQTFVPGTGTAEMTF